MKKLNINPNHANNIFIRMAPKIVAGRPLKRNEQRLINKNAARTFAYQYAYQRALNQGKTQNDGWCAGMIDGDGCISISRQNLKSRKNGVKHTYSLLLHITQNDESTLQALKTRLNLGGAIYKVKRQGNHKRQCWVLTYNHDETAAVLSAHRGAFVRKQQECQLALDFYHYKQSFKGNRMVWKCSRFQRTLDNYYECMKLIK